MTRIMSSLIIQYHSLHQQKGESLSDKSATRALRHARSARLHRVAMRKDIKGDNSAPHTVRPSLRYALNELERWCYSAPARDSQTWSQFIYVFTSMYSHNTHMYSSCTSTLFRPFAPGLIALDSVRCVALGHLMLSAVECHSQFSLS